MSRKQSAYARKRRQQAQGQALWSQAGLVQRIDPLAAFRTLQTAAAAQSKERLSSDQARDLALGYHSALAAFRNGTATGHEANTLAAAGNLTVLLAEGGLGGDEHMGIAKEGQAAVVNAMARHDRTGRWGFTGQEMQAVALLLELHDAQLASPDCTEGLVTAALLECKRRLNKGHTLKVAA